MNFKKFFYILLLTIFSLLFFGCPDDSDNEFYLRGKIISNYPEWLNPRKDTDCCEGISEWTDWQSEQGKLLHDYVPDTLISDDYEGKFRLALSGQDISLEFNDNYSTGAVVIFNWIGNASSSNNLVDVSQTDIENKFEYDCYAKTSLYDGETEKNKAHVLMTRLENNSTENKFNYKLTVAGKVLIELDLLNNIDSEKVSFNETAIASWLKIDEVEYLHFNEQSSCLELNLPYRAAMENSIFTWKKGLYCYEGISLRGEIDDVNQEISFNLLDAEQSDFADYFTLKVAQDRKAASITYYKLENENSVIVRSDKNLECMY